jgi:glucose-6-phosphate-specific signal transduction histidine kinase
LRGKVFRGGLRMYTACPECRVVYGRENGYFTGAMIVSYMLAVPLLAALVLIVAGVTQWLPDLAILVGGVLFLPFVPALFRYSRVVWMHFDRMVDPSLESERFVPPRDG